METLWTTVNPSMTILPMNFGQSNRQDINGLTLGLPNQSFLNPGSAS